MIRDLAHVLLHTHRHVIVASGIIRSCQHRITGRTRFYYAPAADMPVWEPIPDALIALVAAARTTAQACALLDGAR